MAREIVRITPGLVAYLKDVKASGTAGGTFTSGSYQTRVLNTVEGDSSIVSLLSNQFTLQAGTYEIEVYAPAASVDNNKAKLRNITDSTDTIIGNSNYTNTTDNNAVPTSKIVGTFSISSAKVFEIQHRSSATQATTGFGRANTFGDNEIFTIVKIRKVA